MLLLEVGINVVSDIDIINVWHANIDSNREMYNGWIQLLCGSSNCLFLIADQRWSIKCNCGWSKYGQIIHVSFRLQKFRLQWFSHLQFQFKTNPAFLSDLPYLFCFKKSLYSFLLKWFYALAFVFRDSMNVVSLIMRKIVILSSFGRFSHMHSWKNHLNSRTCWPLNDLHLGKRFIRSDSFLRLDFHYCWFNSHFYVFFNTSC